jgi:peptidoglycan LD-endopeptidase LytH
MVSTSQVPDFIRRYPALVDGVISEAALDGWRIEFTYYGAPKKWSPLISKSGEIQEGKLALVDYDKELITSDACRKMLRFRNGKPTIGPGLQTSLQLLFGFR